ncbi:hypothetical protein [Rhodococcus sp. 14-2483-1-2]|uniref:hypothetical protein n=1 Tax=Rhodococcus sp. 14-2483-1-2 TaxID=2023147 RepID=UPI000B9AFA38|nr:hypothetical protein [Rhodococcus sp. 14-2483-1-2]OZF39601.1 hypothetical protein CH295_02495 [Rhodococcus sp. 14-2483-1-2]
MNPYENTQDTLLAIADDPWFGTALEKYSLSQLRSAGLCATPSLEVVKSRDFPSEYPDTLIGFNRDDEIYRRMKMVSECGDAAILVGTGSYAPMHGQHVELMATADRAVKELGYTPVAAVFSLQSEAHVRSKVLPKNPKALVDTSVRRDSARKILPEMLNEDTPVFLDVWDASYSGGPRSFSQSLIRISRTLHDIAIRDYTLFYVFGADNAVSMRAFSVSGYAVCVLRPGVEESDDSGASRYASEPQMREAIRQKRVLIVNRESSEDISSTMIRAQERDL